MGTVTGICSVYMPYSLMVTVTGSSFCLFRDSPSRIYSMPGSGLSFPVLCGQTLVNFLLLVPHLNTFPALGGD